MTMIQAVAKAIVAGAGTLSTAIVAAVTDGNITGVEWAVALLGMVIASAAVWAYPNKPA